MSEQPLARLARLCGVALDYVDAAGHERLAPDTTLRHVLAAMGHGADTEAAIEDTIESVEAERWQRRLPPSVSVTVGERSLRLELTLPRSEADGEIVWRFRDEHARTVADGRTTPQRVAAGPERRIAATDWVELTLELPVPEDPGYHTLEVATAAGATAECLVIVAPRRCFLPDALDADGSLWGLSVQLYGLRSQRNWGIGDFTDLMRAVEFVAARGGSFVGLNPLHELGAADGASWSPYWPSSRRFLSPLYIDVEAVPEYAESESARRLVASAEFQAQLRTLRSAELVEYGSVWQAKRAVLEALFEQFYDHHRGRGTARDKAFETFCDKQPGLEAFLGYAVMQDEAARDDADVHGWHDWPDAQRRPGAIGRTLRRRHKEAEFVAYLQWNAHLQLDGVDRRARELGMAIGICADLALGARPSGADSWVDRHCLLEGLELGAPPDDFNSSGQAWGLPVWNPEALRAARYAPFVETLRANMKLGGALRIDHIMSLMRCFVIPHGVSPRAGTYLHYRLEDMLAIVALESQRNRCAVIGEDLGTVPEAIRAGMRRVGALGYRVLFFERDATGAVTAPAAFARDAFSVASTHDLPTLAGFWVGRDIEWRTELGMYASAEERERHIIDRAEDRARLLVALEREGLAPAEHEFSETATQAFMSDSLRAAFHAYLARSNSRLVGIQAEDLLGEIEQANLPGSPDGHPNWRRRLGLTLEAWADDPGVAAVIEAVRAERLATAVTASQPPERAPEAARAEIPRATYRVQLHGGFRFVDLTRIVPYLDRLGISHCYCSPYFKARPGSTHGYDVIDHTALNPEIGTREELEFLSAALAERGMGQVLDTVPNHVAVMGCDNAWWLDVLQNGPASIYADYFDIDWRPLKDSMRGKVLLPVLGDHYGNVLDAGELELGFDDTRGSFTVRYGDHRLPIDPREYPRILEPGLERLRQRLSENHVDLLTFESLITAFGKLPSRWHSEEPSRNERDRDCRLHQERLGRLAAEAPDIAHYISECLRAYNGDDQYPADPRRMHELLEAQAYRLAYWRLASHEINYRRFFDINELASLRMEVPEVFEATHTLVFELIASGIVQGLRIDHPDGLYDPKSYFVELQRRVGGPAADFAPDDELPLYVVVEKILAGGEGLRPDWPVHGTTGYDFANIVTRFLVQPTGVEALDRLYRDIAPHYRSYEDELRRSKRLIMQTSLASELNVLANDLDRLAEQDPHTRDFGLGSLHRALLEVVASFPVYRTYNVGNDVGDEDAVLIDAAVDAAKAESEAADTQVFEYLRDVLLHRRSVGQPDALIRHATDFGMRLQQYTSPVAAKGMEDTTFYRYARLIALNEVGGTPEMPAASVDAVHRANEERVERWPHAMLASSTHDAKRSEDVRARIAVLSEVPDEWAKHVEYWCRLNAGARTVLANGEAWPDMDFEYFLYQTLVGTWPLIGSEDATRADYASRLSEYSIKAAREAKRHTSWINENVEYEIALVGFVRSILDPAKGSQFMADFEAFQSRILRAGLLSALSQLTLKLASPGVPDIYQGNELWRFDLVDPDNRRPVDFERAQAELDALCGRWSGGDRSEMAQELVATLEDGRLKLFLTWRLLELRRAEPGLFANGSYERVRVTGPAAQHVIAFLRRFDTRCALVVALRWHIALLDGGRRQLDTLRLRDTTLQLPAGASLLVDWLADCPPAAEAPEIPVASLLGRLPVAVLVGSADSASNAASTA